MQVETILKHIALEGFCIVENVIPDDQTDKIRDAVITAVDQEKKDTAEKMASLRGKGHRIGGKAIDNVPQLLRHTQVFAQYISDERILGTAEAMFGPYVKTSATIGLINNPGTSRGYWHSDWPFNQTVANHVPAPYPDSALHLSSIWMLTPFNEISGGTLVVPGSHRMPNNPSGDNGVDRDAPYPTEVNAMGNPGSVLLFDSRLWLNLEVEKAGSPEHQRIVVEPNGKGVPTPPIPSSIYEQLPANVKPLYRYWVED